MKELVDIFELPTDSTTTCWEVMQESKEDSKVDGKYIIARAVGPSFLVNGASANGRYYPEKLWENAIKENKGRMAKGQMLGTIGHDQVLDDGALAEGKASHMVSKLWIDPKTKLGMSEILVLNSKTGRELNVLLRAGMEFPVSSRGFGEYNGQTKEGYDIVDPDKFQLECFDFVRTPGVASAVPKVVEGANQPPINNKPSKEQFTMDTKDILESVTKEKMKLESDLSSAIDKNQSISVKLESAEGKIAAAEAAAAASTVELDKVKADLVLAQEALKAFEDIGDVDKITEALSGAKELSEKLQEIGTLEDIAEKLAALTTYEELGQPEAIAELLAVMETYMEIGTPAEIQTAFEGAQAMAESVKADRSKAEAALLAQEKGVDGGIAERLLSKMDRDSASEIIESLRKSDTPYDLYHKKDESKEAPSGQTVRESVTSKSRLQRLSERLG